MQDLKKNLFIERETRPENLLILPAYWLFMVLLFAVTAGITWMLQYSIANAFFTGVNFWANCIFAPISLGIGWLAVIFTTFGIRRHERLRNHQAKEAEFEQLISCQCYTVLEPGQGVLCIEMVYEQETGADLLIHPKCPNHDLVEELGYVLIHTGEEITEEN